MVSEISNQTEAPVRRFRVRFIDGSVWVILAVTFQRQLSPEDVVKFYKSHNVEDHHVFLRAPDVTAIAPDANLEATPPIIELQNNFKTLASRVDALENSLSDIVTSAVNAAFAARGM